jgi:hypothetical protein
LGGLFPELRVDRNCFEELSYDRTDVTRSLQQFVQARYLDGVQVPARLPCHFFYGRNDELLAVHTPAGQEAYRNHIFSVIPHAKLAAYDIDHFGRGPDRDVVVERVGDVWDQHDNWVDLHGAHQEAVRASDAFRHRMLLKGSSSRDEPVARIRSL